MPDNPQVTPAAIVVGLLIGAVMSVACLALAIFLGFELHHGLPWLFPAMNGVLLLIAGLVAFRSAAHSGIARGVIIALGLAFTLNGLCGVSMLH